MGGMFMEYCKKMKRGLVLEQERAGNIVVVHPAEKLPIGHVCHNRQVMTQAYELGHEVALSQMANIENFLDGLR